ncbi:hypothetical protein [Neisseria meningitidis]|nr:hypothetical protein [Neisseria meningitidis]
MKNMDNIVDAARASGNPELLIFDFIMKRRSWKIAIRFWGYWAFGVS